MRLPITEKMLIYNYYDTIYDMSNVSTTQPTVEQAKQILRESRLSEHERNIDSALKSTGKDRRDRLAKACSGFTALYRNSAKKKVK